MVELTQRADFLRDRVCQARDEAGLNNAELARKAGLPRRTIVRITNGGNKRGLQQDTLEALAAATGKPVGFFSFAGAPNRIAEAVDGLYAALLADLRAELATEQPLSREASL